jgi:hypothetical protein
MVCAPGFAPQPPSPGPACVPCPVGSYCTSGVVEEPCGANCSTDVEGATSVMQCVQTQGTDALALHAQFTFTAPVLGTLPSDSVCAPLNARFMEWTQAFGAFHGCALHLLTETRGTVTCVVAAPRCVAGEYLLWLLALLDRRQAEISAVLQQDACLATPALVLGAPLVQEVYFSPPAPHSRFARPKDAPALVIEPRRWGQMRLQTLATLGVTVAVVGGMLVGTAAACALAMTRFHRRATMRRLFARMHFGRPRRRIRRAAQAAAAAF